MPHISFRARWLLPCLEIIWGIVTFAQSRAQNATQLYVARFFVGMLEAPVFAGTHFILGKYGPGSGQGNLLLASYG